MVRKSRHLPKKIMKVIVTGGNGFVGSHTIKALKEKGYEVLNYDISEGYDLLNKKQLKSVIKKGDKVLHEAAIARFADADKNPLLTYEVNVLGTKNVVEACEENLAERLVYASTGSVYMPLVKVPITEDDPIRGNSVYGCSKAVAEKYVQKCKIPWIVLRYAHLYGEGKIGHGAIGGFIAKMKQGLSPVIFGGEQSNDFTYIKDVVNSNILALETENPESLNQAYNIGTGTELTTIKVFELLREFFKYYKEFEVVPQRGVDPQRFVYDISKARSLLGYNPQYEFIAGMEDWTKSGGKI